jgi:hypothetical protein
MVRRRTDLFVVPVDEYLTRRGEDIGSNCPERVKRKVGEEMGLALKKRPVPNASIVRNSSVEENDGRS